MNASIAGPGPEPLLFSWEPPRRRQIAISTFLALSLIAHALCFYVFQIIYPTTVSLLPPPARVSVISSDSEEGRTLLRWIDAEDPALAFTTQRPPEARLRALPKVEHIPSYLAVDLAFKQVPLPVVDLHIPSSQPCRLRVLPHPAMKPRKRSAFVSPLTGWERFAIAFLSIHRATRPWTNKCAVILRSAVFLGVQ